jgi:hypothetical protein
MSGGFAKEVTRRLYYGNVYMRPVPQLGTDKKSTKHGWPCRDDDKAEMFEKLAIAMDMGTCIPRSDEMVVECGEYEWDNGKIVHGPTKSRGATEKNHGDRAISFAGTWLIYSRENNPIGLDTDNSDNIIPQYGSFLWRERREARRALMGSPEYGIRDVVHAMD